MLKEYKKVSQEKTGWRRLFTDDKFDLYVWYDRPDGEITGFQLVELSGAESRHALTWERGRGSWYAGIMTKGISYATPLLVLNGAFRKEAVYRRFCSIDGDLPLEIQQLARQVIQDHQDD